MSLVKKAGFLFFILIIAWLIFPTGTVLAGPALQQAGQAAVLFVIDDSGSMKTSDPTDLRYAAAGLFIAALDQGDQVGLMRFSTTSAPITAGMVTIRSSQDQAALVQQLQPVKPDGFTDVKAAFESAGQMLASAQLQNSRLVVIFLTDGHPEVPSMTAGYEDEALMAARGLNAPVYAIALTNEGQSPFLTRLAQETGGQIIPAATASSLLDSYLQILGDLKDRTIIGQGDVSAPGEADLVIDPGLAPYVDKATFLVSKSGGVQAGLVTPDGGMLDESDPSVQFSLSSDPRFTVFSVNDPAGGAWRFHLTGSGAVQARVILRSRLRAHLDQPGGLIEAGKPALIVADLQEEQVDGAQMKVVGDGSFSAVITLPDGTKESLDQFYDDGSHGDQVAGDGSYSRQFANTSQSGIYRIELNGRKGAVPVSAFMQFQAVAFPTLSVSAPLPQRYDIRAEPIPLVLHLEGNVSGQFEGGFIARITAPSGKQTEIGLTPEADSFQGTYLPDEDGAYAVTFAPRDASFLGLPYLTEAQGQFQALLVPSLALGPVSFADPTARYEVLEVQHGIPLDVAVTSSAAQAQEVQLRLEGLSGFALEGSTQAVVDPQGVTHLSLILTAGPNITPGVWSGQLFLTPVGDKSVDVQVNQQPVSLEMYQPVLHIEATTISSCSQQRCWEWLPVKVLLKTKSTSHKVETFNLSLEDLPGMNLTEDAVSVPSGDGEMELTLRTDAALQPGSYQGKVQIQNVREGLAVSPTATIPIDFVVESPLTSCQKPLIFSGVGLLVVGLIGIVVARRVKNGNRPPVVRGTLLHWPKGEPNQSVSIDLTAINKGEMTIGKDINCDIHIPDERLEGVHGRIYAQRGESSETRYIFEPLGKVKEGYRERHEPFEMQENTSYILGERVIQFVRDPVE